MRDSYGDDIARDAGVTPEKAAAMAAYQVEIGYEENAISMSKTL
jgi:hypothetical protein